MSKFIKSKYSYYYLSIIGVLIICLLIYNKQENNSSSDKIKYVTGIILKKDDESIIIEDDENNLHEFDENEIDEELGSKVTIEYKEKKKNNNSSKNKPDNKEIIDYDVVEETKIPSEWLHNGIFKDYYVKAFEKMKTLSLDEKIGQTLLVRYPDSNQVSIQKQYYIGGYVFYEKDFSGKTRSDVINMINSVQSSSSIPLLTAIDEEGGKVSRLSSNQNLVSTPFKSPQELFSIGGFETIKDDVKNKSSILRSLGLNLNLAPVVDVSINPSNYIYPRTLGQDTNQTSIYARTVINASKGTGVSYTLKHFPGYGSNLDTHIGGSVDEKSYEKIFAEDIPPFKSGIDAGAEAVMVSHNIVKSIDSINEASISSKIHNILRNDLQFKGIIITDDINMGALKNKANVASLALQSGTDVIITTDYVNSFNQIKNDVNNGIISQNVLDKAVFKIIAWKYYKGLLK